MSVPGGEESGEDLAGALADARAAGDDAPQRSEGEAARVERAAAALERAWGADPAEVERALADVRAGTESAGDASLPAGYEDLGEIGRGGSGVVHRARQRALDREVAVKVLKGGEFLFGGALARFAREARALARLRHPGVVSIHEVGEERGRLWYAMDLVEGRSLAERLREGPIAPRAAARLLADVADAVAYVHDHGLVHRDLKPANILLDANGTPFVGDFGLALELGADDGLTLTGQVVGTPAYMSPEQARGDLAAVGPATDVYALGAVLYECLTGRRPFQGLSPAEQVYAAIHREPVAPRSLDPAVPEEVERVCLQALRKDPADRYASAAALRDDLHRFATGEPVAARPVSRLRRLREVARRRATLVAWSVAGALALVAAWGLLRPTARRVSEALVEAADEALARGDGTGAARLYDRAIVAAGAQASPDLLDHRARAHVLEARALWGSGHAAEAATLMRSELADGEARTQRLWREADWRTRSPGPARWDLGGDVRWELGTARGLEGSKQASIAAFTEALRDYASDFDRDGASVGDRVARTLREASPAVAERAAQVQLGALLERQPFEQPLARLAPVTPTTPRIVGMFLDLAGTRANFPAGNLLPARRFARGTAVAPLLPAFASVAKDPARTPWARLAAAALLAEADDLPLFVRLWESFPTQAPVPALDPDSVVEDRQSLEGLDADEAQRARERLALRTWRHAAQAPPLRTPGGDEPGAWVAKWLESRTGMARPADPDAAARALESMRSAPAWKPLAQALTGRALEAPPDTGTLLHDWKEKTSLQRLRTQSLLRLLAPPGVRVPAPSDEFDDAAWAEWVRVFHPTSGRMRLAFARLVFDPVRGWEVVASSATDELREDRSSHVHVEAPAPPRFAPVVVVTPPGWGAPHASPARSGFDFDARMEVTARGDEVRLGAVREWAEGPGWRNSSGPNSYLAPAESVFSPECLSLGWGSPDPGRNTLHLFVTEPLEGGASLPTTADDWRRRIARDLERLARRGDEFTAAGDDVARSRFLSDWGGEIRALGQLATRVSVPEAAGALRRIADAIAWAWPRPPEHAWGWSWEHAFVLWGRVLARDEVLLTDPALLPKIASVGASNMDVLEARAWGRALCVERDPRVRAVATARLERLEVPPDVAGDLLDAERGGGPAIPASLRAKTTGDRIEDHSTWGQLVHAAPYTVVAALLLLLAAVWTARWTWPARPTWTRLAPAAGMVAVGVAMDAYDLFIEGVDVLPDVTGWALAALGARSLAVGIRGRLARGPGRCFALAACLTAAAWIAPPIAILEALRVTAIAVGIALLPTLADGLRGRSGPEGPRLRFRFPFVLFYGLPMGAALALAWVSLFVRDLGVRVSSDLATAAMVAIGISVLFVLVSLHAAARVRAGWMRLR